MIDFAHLFSHLFSMFWWVIPLLLLLPLFRSAWFKGVAGEMMVNIIAKTSLNSDDYHLFRNVTIPVFGGTTQIDHIIVSRFGIFVVETKNMKGWIFGSEQQKAWTQQIFESKHQFQNPLHQNYKHTKTLELTLGLEPEKLFSVVVFVGGCTFKTAMPRDVTYGGGYISYIKSRTKVLLSEEEVQQVIKQIADHRLHPSIKTHREHAAHVKEIVANKEAAQPSDAKSCPKCGSAMVLRTAEKGSDAGNQFWGCSAFPKCRVVEAME